MAESYPKSISISLISNENGLCREKKRKAGSGVTMKINRINERKSSIVVAAGNQWRLYYNHSANSNISNQHRNSIEMTSEK